MLVMIGVGYGKKELIACDLGYRESTESWKSIIQDLKQNGLKEAPDLMIADGALGLWNAVKQEWPSSKHQRCWAHKIQNVLAKLPKTAHKTAKDFLFQIWQAETKKDALKAYDKMVEAYQTNSPKRWHVWKIIKQKCWLFMISPLSTGIIFGHPMQLNLPLLPCV